MAAKALTLAEIEATPAHHRRQQCAGAPSTWSAGTRSAARETIDRAAELMTGRRPPAGEDTVTFARARLLESQDDGSAAERPTAT